MSFRRQTYPEVLSHLLTGILGGVTAENHPFPPPGNGEPPYRHALEKPPVEEIVSVYGNRNGQSYAFARDKDYKLADDKQTLQWADGAQLPDKGTLLYVNYLQHGARAAADDLQVGSVLRTITESIGLEIARLYAQLEEVYKAGFIDTAAGRALENVVALLGIQRVAAGRFSAELEFTRAPGSHGLIHIPSGARIMTTDGSVEYETVTPVTMLDGQSTVRVAARDVEQNTKGLEAGALTVLAKPISGITTVTNPGPTRTAGRAETDTELRSRAKNFLHGSERATLGALEEAVSRQGVKADIEEIKDENGYPLGRVLITPHAETLAPELRQRINTAIQDARPAGVHVKLAEDVAPPTKVDLKLRITTAGDLLEEDLRGAQEAVRAKIGDYFDRLSAVEAVSLNRIIGLVLAVPEVEDVHVFQEPPKLKGTPKTLGLLEILDPNLPTSLRVVVKYPPAADLPDKPAIESRINAMLTYVNQLNAAETLDDELRRRLSTPKLLYVIPLPVADKPQGSLQEYDQQVADGLSPDVPQPEEIAPYGVQFVFSMQSGLSHTLASAADAYTLTPFERLTLGGVEIKEETP
jgi:hypothetical protein